MLFNNIFDNKKVIVTNIGKIFLSKAHSIKSGADEINQLNVVSFETN